MALLRSYCNGPAFPTLELARRWLLFVWVAWSAPSWACDCEWEGPFTWLVDASDLVVAGEIVATSGNSVDMRVERSLKGAGPEAPIRVWGEYRGDCRADVANFPPGSRWVFILDRIDRVPEGGFSPSTPNVSYGRPGDYALRKCGAYWLRLEDDNRASGNLTSVFEWEWAPEMTPVSLDLLQKFIDGEADYADIIDASDEVTSGEVMLRKTRRAMGLGSEWDY